MFLTRLSIGIQTNGRIEQEELVQLRKISTHEISNSDDEFSNEAGQDIMRQYIIQILKK